MRKFFGHLTAIFVRTDLVNEDLYTGLVNIIPPSVAIIHAQARLKIAQQIVGFYKGVDFRCDHRCAAHAAADKYTCAQFAIFADQFKPNVM